MINEINEWRQLGKRTSFSDIGGACLSTRACLDVYGPDFRGLKSCVPETSDYQALPEPHWALPQITDCNLLPLPIRAEAMAEVQGQCTKNEK